MCDLLIVETALDWLPVASYQRDSELCLIASMTSRSFIGYEAFFSNIPEAIDLPGYRTKSFEVNRIVYERAPSCVQESSHHEFISIDFPSRRSVAGRNESKRTIFAKLQRKLCADPEALLRN